MPNFPPIPLPLGRDLRDPQHAAAFVAHIAGIVAAGTEEALRPRNPMLRAINTARATERREQREDAVRVAIALRKLAEDQRRIEAERLAVAKIRECVR